MEPAIIDIQFPRGKYPVLGYACLKCGEELIPGGTLAQAQARARELGLVGVELSDTRKAMKIGSSIGATFPPRHLERLGIGAGSALRFDIVGDHIEIRAAESEKPRRGSKGGAR